MLLLVIIICVVISLVIYNGLVAKKNAVQNAFASIDVQLKQRHDLIPNLVATVQKYMSHERDTLEELTRLRSQALSSGPNSTDRQIQIEGQLSKVLHGVMVAVENYPELKADASFVTLQRSLNEVEAQIAAARRTFNSAVTDYNNSIEMFPSNIFASILGYVRKEVLSATEEERQTPSVAKLFQ